METVRKAIVISTKDTGFSSDSFAFYPSSPDANPDRTHITFKGVNCTTDEFLQWFLLTDKSRGMARTGQRDTIIDMGSDLKLTVGATISISYSEFFESFLNQRVSLAINANYKDYINAYKKLRI